MFAAFSWFLSQMTTAQQTIVENSRLFLLLLRHTTFLVSLLHSFASLFVLTYLMVIIVHACAENTFCGSTENPHSINFVTENIIRRRQNHFWSSWTIETFSCIASLSTSCCHDEANCVRTNRNAKRTKRNKMRRNRKEFFVGDGHLRNHSPLRGCQSTHMHLLRHASNYRSINNRLSTHCTHLFKMSTEKRDDKTWIFLNSFRIVSNHLNFRITLMQRLGHDRRNQIQINFSLFLEFILFALFHHFHHFICSVALHLCFYAITIWHWLGRMFITKGGAKDTRIRFDIICTRDSCRLRSLLLCIFHFIVAFRWSTLSISSSDELAKAAKNR